MNQDNAKLSDLQAALARGGARWRAGVTPLTLLPDEQKRLRLGATPPPGAPTMQAREQMAAANLQRIAPAAAAVPNLFDWRNVKGDNFVTDVTDQGACGSCVAFGTVATAEAMTRIGRSDPKLGVDYAEAHLFYCYAGSQGLTCSTGWWPNGALDAFKTGGVVDEACFPYRAGDQACALCADWQTRLTFISGWHEIPAVTEIKNWLSTKGPLTTCFTVYDDFFSYAGGIYKHVDPTVAGGHCVSCVGYSDIDGYWICKNSWGTGWGENGFFRIAYGDSGIDATMWAVEGVQTSGWIRGAQIIGLWSIDQDRNAWVYVDQMGWRRIADDSDNILLDMLAQLTVAKAGQRKVDLYEEQGVIREVYVY